MNPYIAKLLNSKHLQTVFLAVLFLFVLFPFLYLSLFVHPSWDDYQFALNTMEMGFWGAQKHWYLNIQGRYTATALLSSFNPLIFGWLAGIKLLPILVIVLLFHSAYFLISSVGKNILSRKTKLLLALLFIAIYLFKIPAIEETIYWMTGIYNYQIGTLFLLYLLGFLVKHSLQEKQNAWALKPIIIYLLIVLLIGVNETFMLITDALVLIMVFQNLIHKKKISPFHISLFIIALLATLMLTVSPGSYKRVDAAVEVLTGGKDFWFSVYSSITDGLYWMYYWLKNLIVILVSAFFLPLGFRLAKKETLPRLFAIHPVLYFLFYVGLVAILFFPSYWVFGNTPPPRLLNIIYFVFLVGWFYGLQLIIFRIQHKNPEKSIQYPAWTKILFIIILWSGYQFNPTPIKNAHNDIVSGSAIEYNKEMMDRYQILISADGGGMLEVPPLKNKPRTIFYKDISKEKGNWWDVCVARYFKVDSVILKD